MMQRMKFNKTVSTIFAITSIVASLSACAPDPAANFSGYKKIAELATLDCAFHNVAEIKNQGTGLLFGTLNLSYKKAWFEYDGKITLGIDVKKVKISKSGKNNVVTIAIPNAQVLGKLDADVKSFSDVYSDKLFFTPITSSEHTEAYKLAQKEMKKVAESNQDLLDQAKERAKILLEQYVKRVGKAYGVDYKVEFVDAKK